MWFVFALFFLLYGQLFWAIKQSRGRINGVSYCWSGFGFQKWTNVRDFEDYSTWVSLVLRSEGLGGHLYADCDLLHWLPWNSNNGFLGHIVSLGSSNTRRGSLKIKLRRHATACILCELECHFPSYSRWRRLSV